MGNKYCSSYSAKGGLGLRDWSQLIIKGNGTTVQSLGVPLCTSGDDVDYCVSRDDSIFLSTNSSGNILISYHKPDGSWTNPKILNKNYLGWAPCLSVDNKYLFYTYGSSASNINIYWAKIDNLIDSLKHTEFNNQ